MKRTPFALSKEKQLKLIEHFSTKTYSVLVKINKITSSYYFLRLSHCRYNILDVAETSAAL